MVRSGREEKWVRREVRGEFAQVKFMSEILLGTFLVS